MLTKGVNYCKDLEISLLIQTNGTFEIARLWQAGLVLFSLGCFLCSRSRYVRLRIVSCVTHDVYKCPVVVVNSGNHHFSLTAYSYFLDKLLKTRSDLSSTRNFL